MSLPPVVSRDEWVVARKALLGEGEGAHPAARRAERRAAPAADGRDRQGLRVRRPGREGAACSTCSTAGASSSSCTSCSTRAGTTAARAAPPAPTRSADGFIRAPATRATRRSRRLARAAREDRGLQGTNAGWTFPWYSSFGTDFNYDFHVTLDESVAPVEYNYRTQAEFEARGVALYTENGESQRAARSELLPARRRPRVPHVLGVRARHGVGRRLVLLPRRDRARPPGRLGGAEGPRRGRGFGQPRLRHRVARACCHREMDSDLDHDLDQMSPAELIAEVKKLRQAIREHRDTSEHDLCWHHPALWGLLPEQTDPVPVVPEWPQFIRGLREVPPVTR